MIKRGGGVFDDVDDDRKMSGSKRSIRDRLGSNVDTSSFSMSKRCVLLFVISSLIK